MECWQRYKYWFIINININIIIIIIIDNNFNKIIYKMKIFLS